MGGERSTDEANAQWQTRARGGDMKVHLLQSWHKKRIFISILDMRHKGSSS